MKTISKLFILLIVLTACGGGAAARDTKPTAVGGAAKSTAATAASAPTQQIAAVQPTVASAPAHQVAAAQATATRAPATPTAEPVLAKLELEGATQDLNKDVFERADAAANSIIKNVVMATGVTADYEPVGVTTEFPQDTALFYAIVTTEDAPPQTIVTAQWAVVDVGDLAPPDMVITESEIEIEGSINIAFSLKPDAGKLPSGAYRVNVFVDNEYQGTVGFQVQGAPQQTTDVISRIVPFHETDAQGEPIDNRGKFPNGVKELAVAVYYANARPGTTLSGDWIAIDLGGAAPNNSRLATTEKQVEGSNVLTLSITSTQALPEGLYQVKVSADGTLVQAVNLVVGGAVSQPSEPTTGGTFEYVGDLKINPAPDGLAGLALDAQGNVYLGIVGGLLRIAPDGSQKKFGESGDAFSAQDNKFLAVNDIAVAHDGRVYTIDTAASVAQKGDADGNFKVWGASELYSPFGIALDAQDNVYIADTFNRRVAKFAPDGKLLAEFKDVAGGIAPLGIAISERGNIILTDGIKHRIVVLDPNGNLLVEFGKQGSGPGEFNQPAALALSGSYLLVVDAGNQRVQVIDNEGKFVSQFGQFSQPRQIAVSPEGTIYVSDFGKTKVQMFRAGKPQAHNAPSNSNAGGAKFGEGNVIVDIGFRPERDGFSFENYGGEYPRQQGDVYVEDMIRMFGEQAVCAGYKDGACQVSPAMLKYADAINEASNAGHCEGMAVLSMRFFEHKDKPDAYQANVKQVFDLKLDGNQDLRREIMYYFALQGTAPTFERKNASMQKKPSQVVDDIITALQAGDPMAVAIRQKGVGGHAISPYAVEDRGNGIYFVWVYDNNWPGEARYIQVDRNAETWDYSFGALNPTKPPVIFNGDANTHTFGAVPISVRDQPAECLFCADALAKSADALTQFTLFGQGDLLITNADGQRIGLVNGELVNEIPGADALLIDTGLGVDSEPIYFVPTNDRYQIALNGSDTASTAANLFVFGGGAVMELDNISLAPGQQDRLTMDTRDFDFEYYAGNSQQPKIDLAVDGAQDDYLFEFDGLHFDDGETIGFRLNDNKLVLNGKGGSSDDTYSFSFTSVGDDGTKEFFNDTVALSNDATQYLDYGSWDDEDDTFDFQVDEDGDGVVDQEFSAENQ